MQNQNLKNNFLLIGQTHPAPQTQDEAMLGKYGAIVAVRSKDSEPILEEGHNLSKQLCQHIIGETRYMTFLNLVDRYS